ncbi:hypothetical protein [Sphingopyxis sp. GW247-27LB]|uniref:hypothetical protein n=1 Tax=Sphingopyxis sp. GW247-27LB TaxID=2012632 RepID=UPI000BA66AEE|nr:hypothetical protein [Sphingopyxis sp. GW247-27LB]PAL25487.1 hypothetical protein CD928_03165 [Sphingopyxis sp. GW247-27LB]
MNEDAALILAPVIAALEKALADAKARPGTDPRMLAIARTDLDKAIIVFGFALSGGGVLDA